MGVVQRLHVVYQLLPAFEQLRGGVFKLGWRLDMDSLYGFLKLAQEVGFGDFVGVQFQAERV